MREGKEEKILELFFDEPTKHWHFEEILNHVNISRPQAALWLKRFAMQKLVLRNKRRGKMPYYTGNCFHPAYQSKKKIFALTRLERTGFIRHLLTLPQTKTIAAFGSFVRGDWYKESDIDLFIYGSPTGLKIEKYRRSLGRPIHLILCRNNQELTSFSQGILKDAMAGYTIRGDFAF